MLAENKFFSSYETQILKPISVFGEINFKVRKFNEKYCMPNIARREDVSEMCWKEFHSVIKLDMIKYIRKCDCYSFVSNTVEMKGILVGFKISCYHCNRCSSINYPSLCEWMEMIITCEHLTEDDPFPYAKYNRIIHFHIAFIKIMEYFEKNKEIRKSQAIEEEKRRHDDLVSRNGQSPSLFRGGVGIS